MILSKDLFLINPEKVSEKIEKFIAGKMDSLYRKGIVVPISGGVDSSTVAALCVKAVGKEKVTGLMLNEKQGNPEANTYGLMLARHLGIQTHHLDITPTLKSLGTYDFILSKIPGRPLRENLVKGYLHLANKNPFLEGMKGSQDALFRRGYSTMNSKHRTRLVITMLYAEDNNLLVAGAAHLTEDKLGLFVKFGVDDCADVMPLKNMYRSHVLQLAEYLAVPHEIIGRTPNPDIIPGVRDKYRDILGIGADTLDLLLFGLHHGMSCSEIAVQLDLEEKKVREIEALIKNSAHMRNPSMALSKKELGI